MCSKFGIIFSNNLQKTPGAAAPYQDRDSHTNEPRLNSLLLHVMSVNTAVL